jgi:hypothetical protein
MSTMTTLDDMKRLMPNKKSVITQEAVDIINASVNEPEFQGESLVQTATTYENVLKGVRASIPEYLNAIRFCAYMLTNEENYTEAYKRVFNNRDFVKARAHLPTDDSKYAELTSAASRYRRSKLVVDILTVSQVPLDLIFSGHRYKAIGVLADVMENGKYDRDRVSAAKELLAATQGTEHIKIELDIGVKEDSAVKQMNDQLIEIAARQKMLLESKATSLEEIGALKVKEKEAIEGEYSNV